MPHQKIVQKPLRTFQSSQRSSALCGRSDSRTLDNGLRLRRNRANPVESRTMNLVTDVATRSKTPAHSSGVVTKVNQSRGAMSRGYRCWIELTLIVSETP